MVQVPEDPDSILGHPSGINRFEGKESRTSRQGKKNNMRKRNVDIHLSTFNCHIYSASLCLSVFSPQKRLLLWDQLAITVTTMHCGFWERSYLQWGPKRHRTIIPRKRHRLRNMDLQWLNQAWSMVGLLSHISDRKKLKINFLLKKLLGFASNGTGLSQVFVNYLLRTWFGKAKTAEHLLVVPAQSQLVRQSPACTATENQRCSHLRLWCQRVAGGGKRLMFMKSTSWTEESVEHGNPIEYSYAL